MEEQGTHGGVQAVGRDDEVRVVAVLPVLGSGGRTRRRQCDGGSVWVHLVQPLCTATIYFNLGIA